MRIFVIPIQELENLEIDDYIAKQLEKLGYWKTIYSKSDYFGTGPTKLALIANEIMKKNGVEKVLELGCGQGRDCVFFAESGYAMTAIDFSSEAIGYVKKISMERKLSNLNVFVKDLQDIDFSREYDCVYSNLALQFFNEPELNNIFERAYLSLKNNGFFIFSTKKPGDKYYEFGEKINDNAYSSKGIVRYFFDKDFLTRIIEKRFHIERFGEETHVNPDGSKSMWWYSIARKK